GASARTTALVADSPYWYLGEMADVVVSGRPHWSDLQGGRRDVARDFLRRCTPPLGRRGDPRREVRHPADGAADLLDRRRRALRAGPHAGDPRADFIGRFRALHRKLPDLGSRAGKITAGFAGTRRLDRRVERPARHCVDRTGHFPGRRNAGERTNVVLAG